MKLLIDVPSGVYKELVYAQQNHLIRVVPQEYCPHVLVIAPNWIIHSVIKGRKLTKQEYEDICNTINIAETKQEEPI